MFIVPSASTFTRVTSTPAAFIIFFVSCGQNTSLQPLNEDAPLLGVNLQANQESAVGVVQIPRKDSFVMVGFVQDGAAGMVLLCDDIEEAQVVVKDPDTASVVVNEKGVCMNGGSLGGLVKVEDITSLPSLSCLIKIGRASCRERV